jgi:hypothetical protein
VRNRWIAGRSMGDALMAKCDKTFPAVEAEQRRGREAGCATGPTVAAQAGAAAPRDTSDQRSLCCPTKVANASLSVRAPATCPKNPHPRPLHTPYNPHSTPAGTRSFVQRACPHRPTPVPLPRGDEAVRIKPCSLDRPTRRREVVLGGSTQQALAPSGGGWID